MWVPEIRSSSIGRALPDATVAIDGVVDLPNADSIFQAIGVPPGAAPQAPPDNVLDPADREVA